VSKRDSILRGTYTQRTTDLLLFGLFIVDLFRLDVRAQISRENGRMGKAVSTLRGVHAVTWRL